MKRLEGAPVANRFEAQALHKQFSGLQMPRLELGPSNKKNPKKQKNKTGS